jgi:serine protease Do
LIKGTKDGLFFFEYLYKLNLGYMLKSNNEVNMRSLYYALVAGSTGVFVLAIGAMLWYKPYHQLGAAQQQESSVHTSSMQDVLARQERPVSPTSVEKIDTVVKNEKCQLSKQQLWSVLQQQLKDTVVQVFAQIAEFNWVEPYKTPNQAEATGTAFFINNQGDLITNAHVVEQARAIFIQVPSVGKRRFEVSIVGVSPERDLALLRVDEQDFAALQKELRTQDVPYLQLGDSDLIHRADKLMALGYPLGQQGLKSTTGVVSGREHLSGQHFIQISAPINKGNSGGPSLNSVGEVIGVNSAIIQNAQNVGYIIPINEVKLFLDQLATMSDVKAPKLLRKPFLGVLFNNASDSLTAFLKNPPPGGLYVVEVYKRSPLYKAGVQAGDMIYSINNYPIDIYGEMNVPWSKEDKVSIIDYVSRLAIGQEVTIEYYRKGVRKRAKFKFDHSELPPIRRMFPGYEKIDYEVIGGLVIMPLTINHIMLLAQYAPDLVQYADVKKHMDPVLLITHVLLNSPASRSRCVGAGMIIAQINGENVKTLDDVRRMLPKSIDSGYLTLKTTENVFVALPLDTIMENEPRLASSYFYPLSQGYKELAARMEQGKRAVTQ